MQSIVGLALGGKQLSGLADDLLKDRHAESGPQTFAIRIGHPVMLGPSQNIDRMRQRWDAGARKNVQLFESAGDGSGSKDRRLDAPAVREHPHRAVAQRAFLKPGNQHRCAGRGMDGVHKRVFPSAAK